MSRVTRTIIDGTMDMRESPSAEIRLKGAAPVTTSQHLTSLLVRLEHASALELDDTLKELLGYPDALD